MQQYLKFLLFSCLLFQATLGDDMLEDMVVSNMEESMPLNEEQLEEAPKINWQPVWELETLGAEMKHHQMPVALYHHLTKNTDKCAAANGLGFKNLLQEAKALLPLQQIKSILLSAASDPEVQAFKRLVTSPEFLALSSALKQSREFGIMRYYSCKVLHLDLKYYAEFLKAIFHPVLNFSDLSELSDVRASSGGIRGLLMNIREVLPVQELRDMYQRLLATDESLKDTIVHMKTKENHQILLNLHNRPEYLEMRKMMTDIGVPLDDIRELVATAGGWHGQSIGGDFVTVLI